MKKNYPKRTRAAKIVLSGVLTFLIGVSSLNAQSPADAKTAAPSAGCTTAHRPLDYDGDGRTDATVVRNTGGGASGQITWFSRNSSNGNLVSTAFGLASDFFVDGDFDGDGKSDITVWRSGTQGYFYILQSQTNTLRIDTFGQTGDDPSVVGDYTGDGKADPAIYRSGATAGSQSIWAYRASSGPNAGNIVIGQFGQNGDFAAPGDYDGDGKYDFAVQRGVNGSGIFYINQSTAGFTAVQWGISTDVVVPGYYDNDCKTDIAVMRSSNGSRFWYIRNSTNGALQAYQFGTSSTDFSTQGDYDGDGATDIAVWRPNAASGGTAFYWRRSIDGALGVQQWGSSADYPVANFNSH